MILRLSYILILLITVSLSGCSPSAEIYTSLINQRAGIDFKTYSSGNWTIEGLDTRVQPRGRSGYYSTTVSWTPFLEPNELGEHSYSRIASEKNGVVYTSRAGHLDIGHVRKMADWTGYFSAKTLELIEHGNTEFQFRLYEPSMYFMTLSYPENWDKYSEEEKERIAREVSIKVGMYLAYNAGVWHEILTWFDYRPKEIFSDFPSAFAWEDMYSNLLGILLAQKALQKDKVDFSSSMTNLLDEALNELGVQSRETALLATNKVKGEWFSTKYFFTVIDKRNFDIGMDDGLITPNPVQGISICKNAKIKSLELPDWDISEYGFSLRLEIEPREWEKNKILKAAYPNKEERVKRIEIKEHLPIIMSYIKDDAIKRGYVNPENIMVSTFR